MPNIAISKSQLHFDSSLLRYRLCQRQRKLLYVSKQNTLAVVSWEVEKVSKMQRLS